MVQCFWLSPFHLAVLGNLLLLYVSDFGPINQFLANSTSSLLSPVSGKYYPALYFYEVNFLDSE